MLMRRLRRYSLRTLLLVFAVGSVFFGFHANRAHQQRRAIKFIRALDEGYIGYNRRVDDLGIPGWLRDCLGDDWFASVTEIHLGQGITSQQLPDVVQHLRHLPKLRTVYLWDANVTDEDFRHLIPLTQISHLGLHFPWQSVTGAGIADITSMDNVQNLTLSGHSIKNDGLRYLPQFTSLEWLSVGWSGVDDEGLQHLSNCHKLTHVTLSSCRSGIRGLRNIVNNQSLETLQFLNMEFESSGVTPWNQNKTNTHFVDEDFIFLYSGKGYGEKSFANQSAIFDSLESWLVSQRPGLEVSWGYID